MLPSPNAIEQCLLRSVPPPPGFDGEIVRTVLLSDPAAGEPEAFAVVTRRGGKCVSAGGIAVLLVSLQTPMGAALSTCRPGDDLPLGRVLAVDDSLTGRAEARRQAEAEHSADIARRRDAKAAEALRLAAEREAAKQQEQEAFERRAAAHFERTHAAEGNAGKAAQLEWPL